MHVLVSLPLDEPVEEDLLLANVRKGLGSSGKHCDALSPPPIEDESIDCLFEAEERVSTLENLVQDAIRRCISSCSDDENAVIADNIILGKTFDHFLKSFKWQTARYPLSIRVTELLSLMEQEISAAIQGHRKKSKEYEEEKKRKEEIRARASGSIYSADINKIAYRKSKEIVNSFFTNYYICVREKMRPRDIAVLQDVDGLFIETKECVYTGTDGEIYQVLGRAENPDAVLRDLEKLGYATKSPTCSREAYRKVLEEEKAIEEKCRAAQESLRLFVSGKLGGLYSLAVHAKHLGLYIESMLKFGPPSSFCFFVVEYKSLSKVLGKWRNIAKTWKYSSRLEAASKHPHPFGHEQVYAFAYRTIDDFGVSGKGSKDLDLSWSSTGA